MTDKPKSPPKDAKQQKADRLAQALRDNLFKRKAQARRRTSPKTDETNGQITDQPNNKKA